MIFMTNELKSTIKDCIHSLDVSKRYMRPEEAAEYFGMQTEDVLQVALAAGARYQLPKITLIHVERMNEFMKHLYRVPRTNKIVNKKFVRIGEGSITYSIGHHRFVEMARAAGAVYKIGDSQGGTVLINLELFDEYMERFHIPAKEMKNTISKTTVKGE